MLHLVGVSGALDEDQRVLSGGRHVMVQILQKLDRVAVGEVVVGADQKRAGMRNLFRFVQSAAGKVVAVDLDRDMQTGHFLTDALHDLRQNAAAVFRRAAVCVHAMIHRRADEPA